MNKNGKGLLLVIVLCALFIAMLPAPVLANAAEPPSLVILINKPPDDLSIVMVSNENHPEANIRRAAWEGYYVFYSRDMHTVDQYTFKVTTNNEGFEFTLDKPLQRYNNVVTLDVAKQEVVN